MRTQQSRSFTDFVSAEQPGLLRVAVLLAGDPGPAEDLVDLALVRTYAQWPRISGSATASAYALDALVGAYRSWQRRLTTTEQVIEEPSGAIDIWADDDEEELRRALRALPLRTRTEVVLRHAGAPSPSRLPAAVPVPVRQGDGRTGPDVLQSPDLDDRLDALAEHTAPPPRDPAELVAMVARRHRTLRLRRSALVALVLAAVVTAALVVLPLPGARTSPAPLPTTSTETATAVYTVPTRGSLAADTAFLEDVRRRPWTLDNLTLTPQPPVDRLHVVWAGDVRGGRAALVAGADGTDTVAAAWFTGPPDTTGDRLSLRSVTYRTPADLPSALADSSTGNVIVVGAPDDEFEVSYRPLVDADGAVRRTYEPVKADDGVALLSTDGMARGEPALRYRVGRDGVWVTGTPADFADPTASPPQVSLSYLRPAPPAAPGDAAAVRRVEDVLARTGLPADQVTVTVVWAGDVVVPDSAPARVTLLVAELPSGAVYVTSALGYGPGARANRSASCGSEIRPAGIPVDQQVFVLRCYAGGGARDTADPRLVVVGPRDAASVEVLDGFGASLGRYPLADGVAVATVPSDMTNVEFLDATGAAVAHGAPLGTADLGG